MGGERLEARQRRLAGVLEVGGADDAAEVGPALVVAGEQDEVVAAGAGGVAAAGGTVAAARRGTIFSETSATGREVDTLSSSAVHWAASAAGSTPRSAAATVPGRPSAVLSPGRHGRPSRPTAGSTVSSTPTIGLTPAALQAW